ncbi:MAG: C4-dicarboxylate ABC transporter [Rubrivivax sp.]|nr:C4-dicarboxylate ABC transporter [Rubrivivax sp.]
MPTQSLKHLFPGWFAMVMGLAGLSLAWHRAAGVMGEAGTAAALALGVLALLVFLGLGVATLLRRQRYPEAWAEDLAHPVRHVFVAAIPVSMILLATTAVAAGLRGPAVEGLWWLGALGQLGVTAWVLSRCWRGKDAGGLPWAMFTPGLIVPIVGNVLVPLAGVPLGRPEWSAAQFGVGVFFWPLVTVLLVVRIAQQGLWPERLLPANLILVAPPAVVGLSLLQLGAPVAVAWALWGVALFSLLWVAPLLPRIAGLPFGAPHWGMSFPLAAFTALTLRLGEGGLMGLLGMMLLALTSLVVAALALATVKGLRAGTLLVPETVPIAAVAP